MQERPLPSRAWKQTERTLAFGRGALFLGVLAAFLIQRASVSIRPPDDPAERLIAPYHNVSSSDSIEGNGYGKIKWWYEEENFDEKSVEGKAAVVTGGNSGIGRAVAEELCRLRAGTVVITSRSLARAQAAAQEMAEGALCHIEPASLDLGDLESVRAFARDFLSKHDKLHYFVMNAGGVTFPRKGKHQFDYVTETGHEYSYVGNFLGHFLLMSLLLDVIRQSAPARITATSSIMHWNAMVEDLPSILPSGSNARRSLEANAVSDAVRQYSNTKFLQVVMCFELQRRLGPDSGVTVTPLAPGYAHTNIGSGNRDQHKWLYNPILRVSSRDGAKTTLHALLSPFMEGKTGYFLQPYWSPLHKAGLLCFGTFCSDVCCGRFYSKN